MSCAPLLRLEVADSEHWGHQHRVWLAGEEMAHKRQGKIQVQLGGGALLKYLQASDGFRKGLVGC